MVNNKKLRRIETNVCSIRQSGGRKKIKHGPVYELTVAQKLVSSYGLVVINTKARDDMSDEFDPELTEDELRDIVLTLREADHFNDSERCDTTNGLVVDGDGYTIWWNRTRKMESNIFGVGLKIYVKFGFIANKNVCLILSIHKSKY